jgi:hypothetical protein
MKRMEDENLKKAQISYSRISKALNLSSEKLDEIEWSEYMDDIVFACQRYYELGKKRAFHESLHFIHHTFKLTLDQMKEWSEKTD